MPNTSGNSGKTWAKTPVKRGAARSKQASSTRKAAKRSKIQERSSEKEPEQINETVYE